MPGFVSVTSRFLYVYLFALNCPGMYIVYEVVSDQEHSLEQAVLGRFFPLPCSGQQSGSTRLAYSNRHPEFSDFLRLLVVLSSIARRKW